MRHPVVAALALSLVAGCGQKANPITCVAIGDPSQPMRIVAGAAALTIDPASDPIHDKITAASFQVLADGDSFDLYLPPQGGHVAYLGARLTNLMSCNVVMRSSIFDIATGNRVQYEERQSQLVASTAAPGWAEPDPFSPTEFDNVPLCPDYLADDIIGRAYALEVKATDRDGRTVSTRVEHVTPRCGDQDPRRAATCACECLGNYRLDKCRLVGLDAGVDAAMDLSATSDGSPAGG